MGGVEGHDLHYVDVTDTFDRKISALKAHESQTAHMDNLEEFVGQVADDERRSRRLRL